MPLHPQTIPNRYSSVLWKVGEQWTLSRAADSTLTSGNSERLEGRGHRRHIHKTAPWSSPPRASHHIFRQKHKMSRRSFGRWRCNRGVVKVVAESYCFMMTFNIIGLRTITRLEQHRTLIMLHSSILLLSWSSFRSACRSQSDSLLLAPSWLSSLGANFMVGTTARHIGQWTEPVKFRRW